MAVYSKQLLVSDLDGSHEVDYSRIFNEASFTLSYRGGMGPGSISIAAEPTDIPIPRFKRVRLLTHANSQEVYRGVTCPEASTASKGGGLRELSMMGWGDFFLNMISPVKRYLDKTVNFIVKDLLWTYIHTGYPTSGKITYDESNVDSCSVEIEELVFTGQMSLPAALNALCDLSGYTWGVYPDTNIYFKKQGTSEIADHRIADEHVENPLRYQPAFFTRITIIGAKINRWKRLVYPFAKMAKEATYGIHPHRGVLVPCIRNIRDARKWALVYLGKRDVDSSVWSFGLRNLDPDFEFKMHEGKIRLRDQAGVSQMYEPPVSCTVRLGGDYSMSLDFGQGDEHLGAVESEVAAYITSLTEESAKPVDLDGRDEPSYDPLTDEDPRDDAPEDGVPDNPWANEVEKTTDDFWSVVAEILDEIQDSDYGDAITDYLQNEFLDTFVDTITNPDISETTKAEAFAAVTGQLSDIMSSATVDPGFKSIVTEIATYVVETITNSITNENISEITKENLVEALKELLSQAPGDPEDRIVAEIETLRWAIVYDWGDDHIVVKLLNHETNLPEGGYVNAAKPDRLMRTGWDGETVDWPDGAETYTYTSNSRRTVAKEGFVDHTEVVRDEYRSGARVLLAPIRRIVETTPTPTTYHWQDLNVDGRQWVEEDTTEPEA